ncbi:hypothetical protein N7523_003417 [Penicillium sp. IBT 18751x]|nr:hypothetical protein N7523_003417 [Penicillium sp. IBT 18751x]
MTTYSIYFTNEYSKPGESQDYALFCDVPAVSSSTSAPAAYSNVFMAKNLARDANWDITLAKNYFAWSGTAVQEIAPGVRVSVGMSKPAILGTDKAPGSTFTMYNNSGSPAFRPEVDLTAPAGAYTIETGTDFTPNLNFLLGMGGSDDAGRMKALASIEAPPNARVDVTPVARYYIAQYSSTVGTVINTRTVSNKAALIDFTANPGQFGAIVTQSNDGKFKVRYVSQAAFAAAVSSPLKTPEVGKLQYYIDQIQSLLEVKEWYACKAAFYGTISRQDKLAILDILKQSMNNLGYDYEGGGIETGLLLTVSHSRPISIAQARTDWQECCFGLPASYKTKIVDPAVNPVALDQLPQQALPEEKTTGAKRLGDAEVGSISAGKQVARKWLQDQGISGVVNGV